MGKEGSAQDSGQLGWHVDYLNGAADPMAAVGLSILAGREEFDVLLRTCGEEIQLLDQSIRMLPLRRRTIKSLEAMVQWMNSRWQMNCVLKESDQKIHVTLADPSTRSDEDTIQTKAAFVMGLLQGMLTWISGGKFYPAQLAKVESGLEIQLSGSPLD